MSTIQIIGTKKCKITQKAERYFKERGISFQLIDLKQKALSKGELKSITQSIPLKDLLDTQSKEYEKRNLKYMVYNLEEELLNHPLLLVTPIVRNKGKATIGYQPEVWKTWL